MQIKNIANILKEVVPSKYNIIEGSSIYGKITTDETGKNFIKLYNGTSLPVMLLSEFNIEKGKFSKFKIEKIEDNILFLKAVQLKENQSNPNSIDELLSKLNIPKTIGKEIIEYLLLYNLPCNDENIMKLYKNINFINKLRNYSHETLFSLLKNYFNENIPHEENLYKLAGEIFEKLNNVNLSHLTFLLQNNAEINVNNIISLFSILYELKLNDLIENSSNALKLKEKKIISLGDIINKIKAGEDLPDALKKIINEIYTNFNLLNEINNNYCTYFFNENYQDDIYKNCIIIKRNNNFDNSIKIYLSVDTQNIGPIETHIIKSIDTFSVAFFVKKEFVDLFQRNLIKLEDTLNKRFSLRILISVEEIKEEHFIDKLNKFFNDCKFSSLDVMV